MSRVKFISSTDAAKLIKDNDTIGTVGFMMTGSPEEVFMRIEERFLTEKSPKNLTFMWASGVGDGGSRGLNHIAHEGLVKRTIAGHYGLVPKLAPLIAENKIEAYNLPQGVLTALFREMAGNRPGLLSEVGLRTFVDPDYNGGKLNDKTTEDLVKKIEFEGNEYLLYKSQKLDVAILRGTEADEMGNVSAKNEALLLECLEIANAVRANGGIVIVQVSELVKNGDIAPKDVKIPHLFVDYIVKVDDQKNHMQTGATQFNPDFITASKEVVDDEAPLEQTKLDERLIIGRRCALEFTKDVNVVNYGIGMPEQVAAVIAMEGLKRNFNASVEPGVIGGDAKGGLDFGSSLNPNAIIGHHQQFDFYDGGGIDISFLGMAQCDKDANINVSKFGSKIPGCGGFINISQNAKKIVFCGTFTAGGLKIEINDSKINIINEGKVKKFISGLDHVTFNGIYESTKGKEALIVTERCVFSAKKDGLTLVEIAPGIDLEKDILTNMEFKPIIADDLKLMDTRIFTEGKLNLVF